MIRRFISVLIIAFLFTGAFMRSGYSQEVNRSPISKALQKLRWDMNMGSAYTFFSGYGGGMSYYAAPGFSYPINKRFSFHGGIIAGVYTMPGFIAEQDGPQKVTSGYTSVYGSVAYHLNQNVVFYGTGVKSLASFGQQSPFFTPSFNEISFGSSIRIGNNVTVGASVHFRDYSPMSGGYYSPFFRR